MTCGTHAMLSKLVDESTITKSMYVLLASASTSSSPLTTASSALTTMLLIGAAPTRSSDTKLTAKAAMYRVTYFHTPSPNASTVTVKP